MPTAFTQIGSTVTVGSGNSTSIDFTSIPSGYTDLKVVASLRCTGAGDFNLYLKINTSSANGSWGQNFSTGTAVSTGTSASLMYLGPTDRTTSGGNTASVYANHHIYIPNYTLSQTKIIRSSAYQEDGTTSAYTQMGGIKWSSNSAITALSLYLESTNPLLQYSTATLYGIKNS
jgi:hypothetical protein